MNAHAVQWHESMKEVTIIDRGGAWFVSYESPGASRLQLLKYSGRPKGFRSLDRLVAVLRSTYEVQLFSLQLESPRRLVSNWSDRV
jgi:hypothetical protein